MFKSFINWLNQPRSFAINITLDWKNIESRIGTDTFEIKTMFNGQRFYSFILHGYRFSIQQLEIISEFNNRIKLADHVTPDKNCAPVIKLPLETPYLEKVKLAKEICNQLQEIMNTVINERLMRNQQLEVIKGLV